MFKNPFKKLMFLAPVFALAIYDNQVYASEEGIVENYADIAFAVYEDSLLEATKLRNEIRALVKAPSESQLLKAREAWKRARVPYSQSEVFRFGNRIVDDWEGKVNAWPLDEGLIDYIVETPEDAGNQFASANVIANEQIETANFRVKGVRAELIYAGIHIRLYFQLDSNNCLHSFT